MAHKAIIAWAAGRRDGGSAALERRDAEETGCRVAFALPHGTLIEGEPAQLAGLRARGHRVKLLPDTDRLRIGAYDIDIMRAPPRIPPALRVPKALEPTWHHHLLQLVAPSEPDWVHA